MNVARKSCTHAFGTRSDGRVAGQHHLAVDSVTKDDQDHDSEELGYRLSEYFTRTM